MAHYAYPPGAYPPPRREETQLAHYTQPPAYGAPPYGYPPHYGPPAYGAYPYGPPVYYPPPAYGPPAYGHPHVYMAPSPVWQPPRTRSRSPRGLPSEASKYTCRFFIGIDNDEEFRVVRRIIGANGAKMKDIVAKAGGDAKLRLRGRGSGFVERDTKAESDEPLQLCISCPRPEGYGVATKCAEALLREIYSEYDRWCGERGLELRAPRIKMTERHHHGEVPASPPEPNAKRRRKKGGSTVAGPSSEIVDRGEKPDGAPDVDEIEGCIEQRNEARRRGDYADADRIRDDLKTRGVVLSDEKGRHGSGLAVTAWRYWRD